MTNSNRATNCCPVIDRFGRHHPTQQAAAESLGVHFSTVSYHLNKWGNLDRVGIGMGRHHGARASNAQPVRLGDRQWSSRTDFARHVQRNEKTVHRWFARGDTDRILSALMHADTLREGRGA